VNREFARVLHFGRSRLARTVTAFAAAGLVLTPAFAGAAPKKRPAAVAVSFDPVSTFTPATADPRLAAAFAGKSASLTDFKFTPAPSKGRPSQVRVAIRARADTPGKVRVADSLTRNIAVTGGVGYRIDHERLSAVTDARRDSQAVYVGTAFKF
jgi:hypothetical protein